jgi:hypothetical protein
MKKFLMFALVTMGLIMNAPAPPPPGVPGPPFVVNPPGPPTFNVPDGGSTALLMGLGLATLAAVRRKKDQT